MRKELMTRFLIAGAAATALSFAPTAGAKPPPPCGVEGTPRLRDRGA